MNIIIFGISNDIGSLLYEKLKDNNNIIGTYNKNKVVNGFKCDLKKEKDIKRIINLSVKKYGSIDVIINTTAISLDNYIENKTKKEFMSVLEVNLVSPFIITKLASPYMKKGIIINIGSTNGIDTYNPISIDYDASKAGLINLTNNLALAYKTIKFYLVVPNWINTKSTLEMDPTYLKNELKRINQKKLIDKNVVVDKIISLLTTKNIKDSIIRIEE